MSRRIFIRLRRRGRACPWGSILLASIFFFVFSETLHAEMAPARKYVLDNGMTVLIQEVPASPAAAVYALVKTGSATEGQYWGTGISHFCEHMLFKGTAARGVGKIPDAIRAAGGTINASTSYDYTIYTIDVPREALAQGLDIISDMLMNSKFDPQELEKERTVIVGEMRLYNDNPDRQLSELLSDTVYTRHPYKYPIIGFESLFKKITREEVWNYYQSTYIPNNIILAVAGHVNTGEVLSQIKTAFKDFERKPYVIRNLPQEPVQVTGRRAEKEYPTDLARLALAYQGVSILDRDVFALDVLAMILAQGDSSRLYQEIVKKRQLAFSISAGNYSPVDRGIFEINCVLEENKVTPVLSEIRKQVELIKRKGVHKEELEKTKRQVLSRYISMHESSGQIAEDLAINEAFTGDFEFSKKYVEAIKEVSLEDIKRVANEYLNNRSLTVALIKPPQEKKEAVPAALETQGGEIKKVTLGNGLTILLREDHSLPMVAVTLALQGGTRQEDEQNNGLFELTSRLWTKGTKSRSALDIAKSVESRGMGLSGFSGRSSFGLSMSFLAEDTDFGLALLEEVIKNPAFPENEVGKIKEEMKASIRAKEDSISAVTAQVLRETLFLKHPSRLDPLGSLSSVERLKRADALRVYRELVVPNNMVLSIFGDVDSAGVLKTIQNKLGGLPREALTLKALTEAPPRSLREKIKYLNKEQAMVMVGFQGATIYDEDRYGLGVLSSLLGSSFNGRLFVRIREELGKAYTLGGSFSPGVDPGLIYFYVLTTEDQIEAVKKVIFDEIKILQRQMVSEEELGKTQAYLKGTFKMGLETSAALSFTTSLDELYGLGFNQYRKYDEKIDRVTREDVLRLAQKYLDLNKAAVVVTRPSLGK